MDRWTVDEDGEPVYPGVSFHRTHEYPDAVAALARDITLANTVREIVARTNADLASLTPLDYESQYEVYGYDEIAAAVKAEPTE